MRILIAGSSGFIGVPLVQALRSDGHEVLRLVRCKAEAPDEVSWSPDTSLDPSFLNDVDVAVNLAGAGIADRRWTTSYKQEIRNSRIKATNTLSRALVAANNGPRTLLNASAVGFYGDRGDQLLDERSPAGKGFLADVCQEWEASTEVAQHAGIRVCLLRTASVLGPGSSLLKRMVPPFRFGLGGPLGNGHQYMPWISLLDEVNAIRFLMEHEDISGPVNLTAPHQLTNAEITHVLGSILNRPTLLRVPRVGLRLVLGELANEVLSSARVVPSVLLKAGFQYQYLDLATALRWSLPTSD